MNHSTLHFVLFPHTEVIKMYTNYRPNKLIIKLIKSGETDRIVHHSKILDYGYLDVQHYLTLISKLYLWLCYSNMNGVAMTLLQ